MIRIETAIPSFLVVDWSVPVSPQFLEKKTEGEEVLEIKEDS